MIINRNGIDTPEKHGQSEAHDWFADTAECLVRFIVAEAMQFESDSNTFHWIFGASKWGGDIVVMEKDQNLLKCNCIMEVKSGGFGPWKDFKQKFYKFNVLVRVKIQLFGGFKIAFYKTHRLHHWIENGMQGAKPTSDLTLWLGQERSSWNTSSTDWRPILKRYLREKIYCPSGDSSNNYQFTLSGTSAPQPISRVLSTTQQ